MTNDWVSFYQMETSDKSIAAKRNEFHKNFNVQGSTGYRYLTSAVAPSKLLLYSHLPFSQAEHNIRTIIRYIIIVEASLGYSSFSTTVRFNILFSLRLAISSIAQLPFPFHAAPGIARGLMTCPT